jgi:hypothetical protein
MRKHYGIDLLGPTATQELQEVNGRNVRLFNDTPNYNILNNTEYVQAFQFVS